MQQAFGAEAGVAASATPIRMGVVGLGMIARAQHLPAIAADPRFRLVAGVDPQAGALEGAARYDTLEAMLAASEVDAVAICTPPRVRRALAEAALRARKHVMLEKPPCATAAELVPLGDLAAGAGRTLFTAWHSCHAAGVAQAVAWVRGRAIRSIEIAWREDVRVWHPGQRWIWQEGGFGVFDPGSNALSILCQLFPGVAFQAAVLQIPENCATPIAATVRLITAEGAPVHALFDFRATVAVTWNIVVHAGNGSTALLSEGGNRLAIDGREVVAGPDGEYPALYARFASLIAAAACEVEAAPLRLIEQCFAQGRCERVEAFVEA